MTADEQGRQCIIVKLKLNSKFLLISQPAQTSPLFLFIHAVIQYCLGTFIKIKNRHQTASATSAVFAAVLLLLSLLTRLLLAGQWFVCRIKILEEKDPVYAEDVTVMHA